VLKKRRMIGGVIDGHIEGMADGWVDGSRLRWMDE